MRFKLVIYWILMYISSTENHKRQNKFPSKGIYEKYCKKLQTTISVTAARRLMWSLTWWTAAQLISVNGIIANDKSDMFFFI